MCSIQMSIVAGEFMGTLQRVDQLITRKYSRKLVLLLTAMLMMIRPVSSLVPVQITSSLSVPTGRSRWERNMITSKYAAMVLVSGGFKTMVRRLWLVLMLSVDAFN
ncbi:hypothetical protein Bca4012_102173 [Brassica carinata]